MNIVQLHERIRFWVDIVSSTRFESQDIDNALNVAIDNKVRESYDQNMPMNKSDAFQRVQRVRDELGPLVKKGTVANGTVTLSPAVGESGDTTVDIVITLADPDSYRHLLALRLRDPNGGWHPCYPLTYDRKNVTPRNPYRRVRSTPQSKLYYYEQDGDILIYHPFDASESGSMEIDLSYLTNPTIVNYGIERDNTYSFSNGDYVIAVKDTYYNGLDRPIGTKFMIELPFLNITAGGLVVSDFIECDVRGSTHEEISRRAAINLLLTANEKEKALALRQEITAQ